MIWSLLSSSPSPLSFELFSINSFCNAIYFPIKEFTVMYHQSAPSIYLKYWNINMLNRKY